MYACLSFPIAFAVADEARGRAVSRAIGTSLGKMHDAAVVHGDLTTSNIMVKDTPGVEPGFQIVMIDFGLATMQPGIEDKAVDLYVLERAFISTHPGCEIIVNAHRSTALRVVNY